MIKVTGGTLPSAEDVDDLLQKNCRLVESLQKNIRKCNFKTVLEEMQDFQVDPEDLDEFLGGLSLTEDGVGTHFLIAPANEEIRDEIEQERRSKTKEFSKCLLGFCNSTFSTKSPPPIETAFRYWPSDERHEDLISSREFFY